MQVRYRLKEYKDVYLVISFTLGARRGYSVREGGGEGVGL